MNIAHLVFTIVGLSLFEAISSIDNAIINAEVLSTMSARARKWFLFWGLLFAVFVVRGVLPWLIIWLATPSIGPVGAVTAAFTNDPIVLKAIEESSPVLLVTGGTFMIFLFFHWLFLEPKQYGFETERFFKAQGVWYFAIVSMLLALIVWLSLQQHPMMAFGAVLGSTAFFIIHGFRQNAEKEEKQLMKKGRSDISKILYLEVIDSTFSIDGVLGAFAFTLSVPLILIGNGLGAIILRQLTVGNIQTIKKYAYLKNGAMYSVLALGVIMLLDAFSIHVPSWISPLITFGLVGYFFYRSKREITT